MKTQQPIYFRSAELTKCLKSHGFSQIHDKDYDEIIWTHKKNDDYSVRITKWAIGVEILEYREWVTFDDMDERRIPIRVAELIEFINRQMAKINENEALFKAIRDELTLWIKGQGMSGKFVKSKFSQYTWDFVRKDPLANEDEVFVLQQREDFLILEQDFNEHKVGSAEEVKAYLLGKDFQDWPGENEPLVFQGKSLYTFIDVGHFRPLLFEFGLKEIKAHESPITMASDDKALHQLVMQQGATKRYTELVFRRPITREQYDEIRNKYTDQKETV